jgi:hypothetical protein
MALYRCYYNRSQDLPLIWSFDEGTIESEIIVKNIHLINCTACTRHDYSKDSKKEPRAWFVVEAGRYEIINDEVYFVGVFCEDRNGGNLHK